MVGILYKHNLALNPHESYYESHAIQENAFENMVMTLTMTLVHVWTVLVKTIKKCNLTLAMSPTCQSNCTILICWHKEQVKVWSRIRPPLIISLLQVYITSQLWPPVWDDDKSIRCQGYHQFAAASCIASRISISQNRNGYSGGYAWWTSKPVIPLAASWLVIIPHRKS